MKIQHHHQYPEFLSWISASGRTERCLAASTCQVGHFKTQIITTRKNWKSLMDLPETWIDPVRQQQSWVKIFLDLERSVEPIVEI